MLSKCVVAIRAGRRQVGQFAQGGGEIGIAELKGRYRSEIPAWRVSGVKPG